MIYAPKEKKRMKKTLCIVATEEFALYSVEIWYHEFYVDI